MRQALGYLFDFEWANKNLFYGAYTRTESYFSNSDLASSGLPQGDELALLQPLKAEIPATVFTEVYEPPKTDGSGDIRAQSARGAASPHRRRVDVQGRKARQRAGPAFRLRVPAGATGIRARRAAVRRESQARVGITMNVRTIDPAQYENRMPRLRFRHVGA